MTKELRDFREDIYKCSRCGLCQSVCPVYKVTLNECCVSKAKFNMLNGVLNGDLALNSRIKDYLDICIGCNACKEFCPSNIDAREIFTVVKAQYYKENKVSPLEKIFDSYLLFKAMLRLAKFSFFFYRFFRIGKMVKFLSSFLPQKILLLNALIKENYPKNARLKKNVQSRILFFPGCFNKYLNASSFKALKKIFSSLDIEFVFGDFECCGVSYLSAGKIEEFKKLAKMNIKKLGSGYDLLLTDCASCNFVLKEYKKYLPTKEAQMLSQKCVNVLDFLKNRKIIANRHIRVTVHKPCHEDFDFVSLLKNIENVEYVEAADFDKCCGFSGKFALKYPEISTEISWRKALAFLDTKADCIVTTCPACVLGVNQGLIAAKAHVPVLNVLEFIAKYCTVFKV